MSVDLAPSDRALDAVTSRLKAQGFDLGVWGFGESLGALAAPFHIAPTSPLLLTGNTRALWPRFTALRASGHLPLHDPLDAHTEAAHHEALQGTPGARALFSHRGAPALPIQRIAAALGLCQVGPAGLAVHPLYGPWFALRALLVFPDTYAAPHRTMEPGLRARPCDGCAAPCRAAFDEARRGTPALNRRGIATAWRLWVAARDACPVGREHRYSLPQLAHHYGFTPPEAAAP